MKVWDLFNMRKLQGRSDEVGSPLKGSGLSHGGGGEPGPLGEWVAQQQEGEASRLVLELPSRVFLDRPRTLTRGALRFNLLSSQDASLASSPFMSWTRAAEDDKP